MVRKDNERYHVVTPDGDELPLKEKPKTGEGLIEWACLLWSEGEWREIRQSERTGTAEGNRGHTTCANALLERMEGSEQARRIVIVAVLDRETGLPNASRRRKTGGGQGSVPTES